MSERVDRAEGDEVRDDDRREDESGGREADQRRADGEVFNDGDRRDDHREQEGQVDEREADERHVDRDPSSERVDTSSGPGATTEWSDDALLSSDDRGSFQKRWDDIQVRFIDEPQQSVREADDLVSEVTTKIAKRFSSARDDMEQRWEGGNEPTTEELRQAVQRYRDFFQRLVAQ